jgi:hypothetical protein
MHMKKIFLVFSALSISLSCSKDSDVAPVSRQGFPQQWIFTKDNSNTEYTYIYTNKYAMFRDDILKSYPLNDLADEEHCLFYISESNCGTAKPCYTIQLDSDRIRFLGVGPSSNSEVAVVGNPSYFAPPDANDDEGYFWRFYIHQMPDVDGVRTFAIESVGMPGWYISDSPPGFNYAATVVTLQKEKSPDNAPKWQGRGIK